MTSLYTQPYGSGLWGSAIVVLLFSLTKDFPSGVQVEQRIPLLGPCSSV